jgi:hypothetical protein
MESALTCGAQDQSQAIPEKCFQPACPRCGGVIVPLAGVVQCTRCRYTFCEGCEPDLSND